jgi:ketosteroid isomerase-like protein
MKQTMVALALLAAAWTVPSAAVDPSDEARAVYRKFVAAQNMHDLEMVGSVLLESPSFLWVSEGKAIWGRDAVLKRMALFQEARIWHVEPALDKSVAVPVSDDTSFLHLPIELTIGFSLAEPEKLKFLVSVLCVRTPEGWRIAALFTTTENVT